MSDISPSPQPFAERLSDTLQEAIKVVVGTHRKPPRCLKSLLNGTWFGHPLHPVMTDVPIVAWLLTAIFDIIWLIAPPHTGWAAIGAFVAVIVGLLGALGAVATGLTERYVWDRTQHWPQSRAVQRECLCSGLWGTRRLWSRVLTYKGSV